MEKVHLKGGSVNGSCKVFSKIILMAKKAWFCGHGKCGAIKQSAHHTGGMKRKNKINSNECNYLSKELGGKENALHLWVTADVISKEKVSLFTCKEQKPNRA